MVGNNIRGLFADAAAAMCKRVGVIVLTLGLAFSAAAHADCSGVGHVVLRVVAAGLSVAANNSAGDVGNKIMPPNLLPLIEGSACKNEFVKGFADGVQGGAQPPEVTTFDGGGWSVSNASTWTYAGPAGPPSGGQQFTLTDAEMTRLAVVTARHLRPDNLAYTAGKRAARQVADHSRRPARSSQPTPPKAVVSRGVYSTLHWGIRMSFNSQPQQLSLR